MSDVMQLEEARGWRFETLVREGLSLIPAYAPDWTNHNASDPGVTLLELFAYISEILIYRALRVTPDAKFNFLRLLGPPENVRLEDLVGQPAHVIQDAIRARVAEMGRASAVTTSDFEALATETLSRLGGARRFRVSCLPGLDVRRMMDTRAPTPFDSPGDFSIVVALDRDIDSASQDALLHQVQQELQQHCLLTTRAHVAQAAELRVFVACRIAPEPGTSLAEVIEAVDIALNQRFDPLLPEPASNVSPFGHTLHLASVAGAIDRTDGVDFVEEVSVLRIEIPDTVRAEGAAIGIRIGTVSSVGEDTRLGGRVSFPVRRFQTDASGEAEAIVLQAWEVIRVSLAREAVRLISQDGSSGLAGGRLDG